LVGVQGGEVDSDCETASQEADRKRRRKGRSHKKGASGTTRPKAKVRCAG
jgi:hypothetical protein